MRNQVRGNYTCITPCGRLKDAQHFCNEAQTVRKILHKPRKNHQNDAPIMNQARIAHVPLISGPFVLLWHHRLLYELYPLFHNPAEKKNVIAAYEEIAEAYAFLDSECLSEWSCQGVAKLTSADKGDPRTGAVRPAVPVEPQLEIGDDAMFQDVCEQRKSIVVSIMHREIYNLQKQKELGEEVMAWISKMAVPALKRGIRELPPRY